MALEMAKSVAAIKSSIYSVQLILLDGISTEEKLHAAGRVLMRSEYADVVTERSIANMCGYPLCPNHLPSTFPRKGRYHISLREHKVYNLEETRLFCSSDCLVASKKFAASLAVERDYSSKTQEFASVFQNLDVQGAGEQHDLGSFASKKGSMLIQELDGNTTLPDDLPLSVEAVATQQTQENDLGTFLLIREQNESRITEFSVTGPSNAIEGYIQQKEFPLSTGMQPMDKQQEQKSNNLTSRNETKELFALDKKHGQKSTNLVSTNEAKDLLANRVKKKEKKKDAAFSSNSKESIHISSVDKQPDFTSCILIDQGDLTKPFNSNSETNPQSRLTESGNGQSLHGAVHKEASTQKSRRQCSRKQNRVSWADHHNLKLVEDLSCSITTLGRGNLCDTSKRVLQGESSWEVMPDSLSSNEGNSNVDAGIGLLQNRKGEEQENTVRKIVALEGSSSSQECKNIPDTTREEHDRILVYDEKTSFKAVDVFAGHERGIMEREDGSDCSDPRNENLESLKALVAALTDAAEAVACGEVDSSKAVAMAGISIFPNTEVPSGYDLKEGKEIDKGQETDVEDIDPRDCWYSAPPKGFRPELSGFGTLWMALDGWISAASIAHVYGRDSTEQDAFAVVNGKEYLRQVVVPNGVSSEIERTFAGCISRTLPRLVEILRFPIPISTLEVSMGRLLRTMSFMTAIPAFSSKQWQVVALILLDALSVYRLPALRPRFLSGRQALHKVLASANVTEAEYEIFRDLVLPMGVLPHFAAHCGA